MIINFTNRFHFRPDPSNYRKLKNRSSTEQVSQSTHVSCASASAYANRTSFCLFSCIYQIQDWVGRFYCCGFSYADERAFGSPTMPLGVDYCTKCALREHCGLCQKLTRILRRFSEPKYSFVLFAELTNQRIMDKRSISPKARRSPKCCLLSTQILLPFAPKRIHREIDDSLLEFCTCQSS